MRTSGDVKIRAATATDAPVLTKLAHAAKAYWGYNEDLIALWASDLTVTEGFINDHPVRCASIGNDLVGFYALSHKGSTFELEHMWVDPSRIGIGVGRRLFKDAIDAVRELGGSVLRIASDPNAEGFYVAMGAIRVGAIDSRPEGRQLPVLEVMIESTHATST
ncbi:MAG: GNAT family N-acetyltransferase [Actinomycetota bacterium]